MKNIILYLSDDHTTGSMILAQLRQAFTAAGYSVLLADYAEPSTLQKAAAFVLNGQVEFSVGMNTDGLNLTVEDGKYLYEDSDILHISILSDAPYNMGIEELERCCKNHAVCYLDRSHLKLLELAYPQKKWVAKLFMPFGGIGFTDEKELTAKPRCFDVVYSANFWQMPRRFWHDLNLDSYLSRLLDDIADVLASRPVNVYTAVHETLCARGMLDAAYLKRLYPYFWHLYAYCKNYRRYKCLADLVQRDICIDVFGAGWEQVPFAAKLRLHGAVSYQENLKAMTQAKIVVTDQAEFNGGAHDRVFTAMLSGAAVIGEYSEYLAEIFTDGDELCLFDWQDMNKPAAMIQTLLSNEPKRLAMALRAYGKAAARHRWSNRAERLLELAALCRL